MTLINKIFILSNETDLSTNNVIDWLTRFKVNFIRVNDTSRVEFEKITLNTNEEILLKIDENSFSLNEVTAYWYRRGFLYHLDKYIQTQFPDVDTFFNKYLLREGKHLIEMLHLKLESKKGIGSINNNNTNKLDNLTIAKSCDLDIPATIVASTKKDLVKFMDKYKKGIISKAIFLGLSVRSKYFDIEGYTSEIKQEDIKQLEDIFAPTLFQEKLEKRYEIRCFYLNGICYSSAIFSQNDSKTSVDFRNYNFEKPNRTPPFKLPIHIEKNIKKFMDKKLMKSGSIDIVVTNDKKFVFLEVNPIGQYSQVSIPCNYNLDQKIANYLAYE